MKATRFLIALLLLATVVGNADAQFKRLSWDGCDPQVPDKVYNPLLSPQNYSLVVSALGLGEPMVGHEAIITVGPALPDAWRFDDLGCQTSSYISISENGLTKQGCPPLKGNAPLAITAFVYNSEAMNADMRCGIAYDMLQPVPSQRYALWVITFDHTYSVVGAGLPGATCGGVEKGLLFDLPEVRILLNSGQTLRPPTMPGDRQVTWNGGPFVPTVPSTWGKVKGLYR